MHAQPLESMLHHYPVQQQPQPADMLLQQTLTMLQLCAAVARMHCATLHAFGFGRGCCILCCTFVIAAALRRCNGPVM
jgi:hypothetical protein